MACAIMSAKVLKRLYWVAYGYEHVWRFPDPRRHDGARPFSSGAKVVELLKKLAPLCGLTGLHNPLDGGLEPAFMTSTRSYWQKGVKCDRPMDGRR